MTAQALVLEQPSGRKPVAGDELVTTKEAAQVLSVHVSTLWRLRRRHPDRFPRPFYLTVDPRWSRAEVLEFAFWLREQRQGASS